jgi:hypothetical protein
MLLLSGQLVELLFLEHLELKHPSRDERKTEEEKAGKKDDPDLKPID